MLIYCHITLSREETAGKDYMDIQDGQDLKFEFFILFILYIHVRVLISWFFAKIPGINTKDTKFGTDKGTKFFGYDLCELSVQNFVTFVVKSENFVA